MKFYQLIDIFQDIVLFQVELITQLKYILLIINENIIEEDRNNKWNKKTSIKSKHYYSFDTTHGNYIDCFRSNGNFIISKSVDGIIKGWLTNIKHDGMNYFLINTYIF